MGPFIDTNVNWSRWPFRRVKGDEPAELVAKLRGQNVVQAWVGSLDGLFHRDVAAVNERLTADCHKHGNGLLVPFGTVNPSLPDWEEDLRRCHEQHRMPGIRLHPNYQGYKLDHPAFARLLGLAAERDLVVQLAVGMEDERTQHPAFRLPHVDTGPLEALVRKLPRLRLVLLNAFHALKNEQVAKLAAAGPVYVEIAMLENVGAVARLLDMIPPERVLFGSHFPLFYHESAVLKLREAALPGALEKAVCTENARRLVRAP
jgi:uncharacterized protein